MAEGINAPSATAHHAAHFRSAEVQRHAESFGMWIFLATEVLLFAGLFVAYACYRFLFHETFHLASRHLDVGLGTTNTLVLITSSLLVALAVACVRTNRSRLAGILLFGAVLLGLVFLGIKGIEYAHKLEEGALPGRYYHFAPLSAPGASLFFTLYFFMTGLHAFHVVAGMSVLVWLGRRAFRREFSSTYYLPVELGGLYWHLVDLVWIFLYPLLYLI